MTAPNATTPSKKHLQLGTVIDGRYQIREVLGSGGFGTVYKAQQTSTGQSVAVKLLHLGDAEEALADRARFEREMQLIAQLKHPNIVRLIDSGTLPNGQLYTVLEYIEGAELSTILRDEGALRPAEAKTLMFQVLDALSVAHHQGIVHRDLKPQNIMVTTHGYRRNAMVLDFGISAIVESHRDANYRTLTMAGRIQGTPAYMAPEQLRAEAPIAQSDIYAWGLVFLECLNGRRAVTGDTMADIIAAQLSPSPLSMSRELVNHPLGPILRKATAKRTDERYPDAHDALVDLDAAQFDLDSTFPWTGRKATDAELNSANLMASTRPMPPSQMSGVPDPHATANAPLSERTPHSGNLAASWSGPVYGNPGQGAHLAAVAAGNDSKKLLLLLVVVALVVVVGVVAVIVLSSRGGAPDERPVETAETKPGPAHVSSSGVPSTRTSEPLDAASAAPDLLPKAVPGTSYQVPDTRGGDMILHLGGGLEMGTSEMGMETYLGMCREALGDYAEYCTPKLFENQVPTYFVEVPDFFLDRLEVNQAAFAQCVDAGVCSALALERCALLSDKGPFDGSSSDRGLAKQLVEAPDAPVICVNQAEAETFCQWAGKRLPAEFEWEYAATNASTSASDLFPWGNQNELGGSRANGADLALIEAMGWGKSSRIAYRSGLQNTDRAAFVVAGGSFPAGRSATGVLDLAGNVREWVAGGFENYGGGSDPSSGATRGGGWADVGPWLGAQSRLSLPVGSRRSDLGFRCAADAPKR